ncbi:MAG TPA: hypothetical protein VIQ55_09930 [Burkholderiales bacterium]|jgi:hypothetical protein
MKHLRTAFAVALLASGPALAHGGLVDVSVFDRTDGRSLPVYWHEGRAYVAGKPGNEYRISLRNRQREDLLAVVSVDGINVITGETAHPSQSGYILAPRVRMDIQGWRRSLSQTAAFYFTSLPDSYAARTGRPNDAGVIGVALFRRKAHQPPAPMAREGAADSARREESRVGTGHGRHETSYAYHTTFERATQQPAETITLFYDSRVNLVARGIIREATTHPRPFPGFVPDPAG